MVDSSANSQPAVLEREAGDGGVVVLRLTNGKANVMDTALLGALAEQWRVLADDEATRAVVVTGSGSMFSAGVDLVTLLDGGDDYLDDFLSTLSDMLVGAFRFGKPMVAAVNGHAIAGGCVLACAADRRYMADGKARIGIPELLVGVPFPLVALEIIKFAAAPKQLSTLVFGGGTYLPADAVRQGLADEVVGPDELLPTALAEAARLGALPPAAFRATKSELRHDGLARIERDLESSDREIRGIWGADETRAAIRRYVDKTLRK